MRKRMKASYKRPVITAVKLDPRAAILETCHSTLPAAGNWLSGANACYGWTATGGSYGCAYDCKTPTGGLTLNNKTGTITQSSAGS